MKKAPVWAAGLLALLLTDSHAQIQTPKVIPVSPEVATLGKFIDTPVGTYSGVPDISIPLYTVSDKSISIPLTLSYHGGGIKVNDEASWCGLGWDIFNGGMISQSIIGDITPNADFIPVPASYNAFEALFSGTQNTITGELDKSLAYDPYPPVQDPPTWSQYGRDMLYIGEFYLKVDGGGQPDIFTYSFPGGHSGKFIINPYTKEPVMLQQTEFLQFKKLTQGWRIKTVEGLIFTFDKAGTGYVDGILASRSWKLTSIKSPDGSVITFEYKENVTSTHSISESYRSYRHESQPSPYSKTDSKSTSFDYVLTKIITSKEMIEFVSSDRDDIELYQDKHAYKLNEIIIKDKVSLLPKRSFSFTYGFFGPVDSKRLKLLNVQEAGYDFSGNKVIISNPYKLQYQSLDLPAKTSNAQDYWGYYNGQSSNTTLIPDLTQLFTTGSEYYFNLSDYPTEFISAYKANRAPSTTYVKAGVLKRITYPTGGYAEYDFESNAFSNFPVYAQGEPTPSNFVKNFHAGDNNRTTDKRLVSLDSLPQGALVEFNITIHNSGPFGVIPSEKFDLSKVRLILKYSDGTPDQVVKQWTWADNNKIEVYPLHTPEHGKYWIEADLDARADSVQPYPPGEPAGISAKFYIPEPYVSGQVRKYYGAGLRIASVKLYDENKKLSYMRRYDYVNTGGNGSGILLSPPKFLNYTTKKVSTCGNWDDFALVGVYTLFSSSTISLSLSPNAGFVGYSTVKVSEISATDSTTVNSSTSSEFINKQNAFYMNAPEDSFLDNGLLLKSTLKNNSDQIVHQEVNKYNLAINNLFYGYTMENLVLMTSEQTQRGCSPASPGINLKRYPIRNQFYQLESKTVKDVLGTDTLTNKTNYTYNTQGMLRQESRTTSNADVVLSEHVYPVDFVNNVFPYPFVATLKDSFYLPPIEEKQFLNGTLQKKTLYTYSKPSTGKFLLQTAKIVNGAGAKMDSVNFKSYSSSSGNIKEYQSKNGITTYVLWGRNAQYPVAKIEGPAGVPLTTTMSITSLDQTEQMDLTTLRTKLLTLYTLTNCMVQLYFYDTKGQLIEIMDATQTSTFFEYDTMGRFKLARDANQNIIKNYVYNYKKPVP